MAKTSLTNIDQELSQEPTVPETKAPVSTELSVPREASTEIVGDDYFDNTSGFEGHYDSKMIQIPWISLVHSVGDLSAKFSPGSLVLNGETVLASPLEVTFVRCSSFVLEDLNNEEAKKRAAEGGKPKRWDSPAGARAEGYVAGWESKSMPHAAGRFCSAADMDVLVKGTPEQAELFPLDVNGTPYLLARIRCKKTQFKLVTEKLVTTVKFNSAKGLSMRDFRWKLETRRGKEGNNWVWRMHINFMRRNEADFTDFAKGILG